MHYTLRYQPADSIPSSSLCPTAPVLMPQCPSVPSRPQLPTVPSATTACAHSTLSTPGPLPSLSQVATVPAQTQVPTVPTPGVASCQRAEHLESHLDPAPNLVLNLYCLSLADCCFIFFLWEEVIQHQAPPQQHVAAVFAAPPLQDTKYKKTHHHTLHSGDAGCQIYQCCRADSLRWHQWN